MPNLFGRTYTKRELMDHVGDISQVANARKAALTEGVERGADLIEVYNASGLCFSILPGRALDVASAHYKGMPLAFRGSCSSRNHTVVGTLNLAIRSARNSASSTWVSRPPGRTTMAAATASPSRSSGRPKTAASATSGCS